MLNPATRCAARAGRALARAGLRLAPALGPALGLGAGGGGDAADAAHAALERGPTPLVVILIDTLRADRLGSYGYDRPTTPHLDAFADAAVRFERCLAQSTWTPSTASLLTGLYPSRHGATSPFLALDASHETLAELLRAQGYATAAIGSNPHIFGGTGFQQGFDTFVSPPVTDEKLGYVRAEELVDAALAWLDAAPADQPTFLYLHLFDPHAPYAPPEPYRARFDRGERGAKDAWYMLRRGVHPEDLSAADRAHFADLYDGEVAYADAQVGRLLAALDLDETAVVVVSDHGEELFDHGGWSHTPTLYDELVRVPLLVSFPSLRAAGRGGTVVTELVQQVDLWPTLLDQLGLPARAELPGRSLLATALGAGTPHDHGVSEVSELGRYKKAVVGGEMKYIRTWAPAEGEELFDLARDPRETENVVADRSAEAQALRRLLDAHVAGAPARYALQLENATDELVTMTGYLVTETDRVSGSELVDCELHQDGGADWDGPFLFTQHEVDGTVLEVVQFTLRTAPGDIDGLVFTPSARERTLELRCRLNGAPLDPAWVHVGADGAGVADTEAIELDLADAARYQSATAPGAASTAAPLALSIWRALDASGEKQTLTDEERARLEQLGYAGR